MRLQTLLVLSSILLLTTYAKDCKEWAIEYYNLQPIIAFAGFSDQVICFRDHLSDETSPRRSL